MFCGDGWKAFRDLPTETFVVDLHYVTRWSKLGTSWEGVSLDTLLKDVKIDASHAMARSYGGYTTNLPCEPPLWGQGD
jgi:DMSO/TMAO reductase YedYZ molybdopterin-dependent catalytic subunit